jgi:histidinol dehydrogenase
VRCERLTLAGEPGELAERLRGLVPAGESVSQAVAEIIARVRAEGDRAVLDYTLEFDSAAPASLRVGDDELSAAAEALDPELRRSLDGAVANVRRVAQAAQQPVSAVDLETHRIHLRREPVRRAAVYVPGGRAPYPSTVVMGVIPAREAGVEEVIVCSPPGPDGEIPSMIIAACHLAGATELYRMGGAQAVAALAFGTDSVEPVDVIVGPGNLYVQEAKRQVFGQVGIDGFAGPSDLLIIVQDPADAGLAAVDLLAQAEHGPGTLVAALSDSGELLEALARHLEEAPATGALAALVQVDDLEQALALSESFAPEHLELMGPGPEALAPRVKHAGCLFVGSQSATAFGDYIAGSTHILPTQGAARFASGLTAGHFVRTMAEVRIGAGGALARQAAPLARAEGFELHARSMEARIGDNPPG